MGKAPLGSSAGSGRRGLTLVDVTITVLIMGILASVAAPRFADVLTDLRVETAASRVAADLELARQHAQKTSGSIAVQFWTMPARYELAGVPDLNHPSASYTVELENYPYSTSVNSAVFGGDSIVVFDFNGMPDSGGTLILQSGADQRSVTIDAATGEVSVL